MATIFERPLSHDFYGRVHIQIAVGLVIDEIVRSADEMKADLVVLGVTKRGRFARLLYSTTGRALGRVRRPVLAVPLWKSNSSRYTNLDALVRVAA